MLVERYIWSKISNLLLQNSIIVKISKDNNITKITNRVFKKKVNCLHVMKFQADFLKQHLAELKKLKKRIEKMK